MDAIYQAAELQVLVVGGELTPTTPQGGLMPVEQDFGGVEQTPLIGLVMHR